MAVLLDALRLLAPDRPGPAAARGRPGRRGRAPPRRRAGAGRPAGRPRRRRRRHQGRGAAFDGRLLRAQHGRGELRDGAHRGAGGRCAGAGQRPRGVPRRAPAGGRPDGGDEGDGAGPGKEAGVAVPHRRRPRARRRARPRCSTTRRGGPRCGWPGRRARPSSTGPWSPPRCCASTARRSPPTPAGCPAGLGAQSTPVTAPHTGRARARAHGHDLVAGRPWRCWCWRSSPCSACCAPGGSTGCTGARTPPAPVSRTPWSGAGRSRCGWPTRCRAAAAAGVRRRGARRAHACRAGAACRGCRPRTVRGGGEHPDPPARRRRPPRAPGRARRRARRRGAVLLLARRVHNDAVRDTLDLRSRRLVRWLRLAGTAPAPAYFEIADPPRRDPRGAAAARRDRRPRDRPRRVTGCGVRRSGNGPGRAG